MKQEHEEINKWIELYSESLLNRALSMVRDKEDAMDLVQEVFISATAAYRTFERKSTPLTWLLSQNFDEPDEQKALMNTLDKCLNHLPSQWQVTVKLYYLEEKKAKEVCQELDITTTNLWKILQRSRMQLRKCIELNWFDKL